MKRIINSRMRLLVITALIFSTDLSAQVFESNKSISEQLKNNAVAGLEYAIPSTATTIATKKSEGSSLLKQIKEGKLGAPVASQNGSVAQRPITLSNDKKVSLPSEATAAELKAIAEANKNQQQALKPIPSQDEVKAEPAKKE